MGLFAKKGAIVCCKCHVSNDKLAKKYQKALGIGQKFSTPAGNFQIVNVEKMSKLNQMMHCNKCGAYFCSRCAKKAVKKADLDPWCTCCPACFKKDWDYLDEYSM